MQKKMLAVAVAGALGAPAVGLAQTTSTVQVFGTLYFELDSYDNEENAYATPAAVAAGRPGRRDFDYSRTAGSEIGFKGEEKLGGTLAAWFQCSSTADLRGQTANGWCSRNSALGMKGAFGNLYFGIWDTPMKRAYSIGNVGSGETGGFGNSPVLMNGATTPAQLQAAVVTSGTAIANPSRGVWSRRETGSIFYDSPNFAGFQVNAAYQTANASTNVTSGSTNAKPRTWSAAATYSAGPLGLSVFYEKHSDAGFMSGAPSPTGAITAFVSSYQMDDRSYGAAAAFTFGPVKVGGVWKREKYDVPTDLTGGTGSQRVNAWHVGVDWSIVGPHGMRAAYSQAGNVKGDCISTACTGFAGVGITPTANGYRPGMGIRPDVQGSTGAAMWQVRYVYAFSKRTEFNLGYAAIRNKSNAGYSFSDVAGNVAPGKDPSVWVTSLRHTF